jgi:heat shock protein HslJ
MIETLVLAAFLQAQAEQRPQTTQLDPAPYEGRWVVELIETIKVMPESEVTINLTRGRISGTASCNTYQGSFTVSDDAVKVGELLKTMKACDGARMIQEEDFFSVLREVVSYEIRPANTLILRTSQGTTITATRAKRPSHDR